MSPLHQPDQGARTVPTASADGEFVHETQHDLDPETTPAVRGQHLRPEGSPAPDFDGHAIDQRGPEYFEVRAGRMVHGICTCFRNRKEDVDGVVVLKFRVGRQSSDELPDLAQGRRLCREYFPFRHGA